MQFNFRFCRGLACLQCDKIGRFIGLWANFKSLFGQLLQTFGDFFWSHFLLCPFLSFSIEVERFMLNIAVTGYELGEGKIFKMRSYLISSWASSTKFTSCKSEFPTSAIDSGKMIFL